MKKDIGKIFRSFHSECGAFIIPNPWDIGSAHILAGMGFKALATTSAGMAFSLGKTDGNICRDDVFKHCKQIVQATPLPVSADLEKGFGDSPQDVFDTVKAAAEVGLAGCSIEDYSGSNENPIFDHSLAVERISAASDACRQLQDDFVLTARCENLMWGKSDLDDVIKRLQAYESAGADVLFAPGLDNVASIRTVCSALNKPVNVMMGISGFDASLDELTQAGVKRISVGSSLAQLAYGSLIDASKQLIQDGKFNITNNAMNYAELSKHFN